MLRVTVGIVLVATASAHAGKTRVEVKGEDFLINGRVTYTWNAGCPEALHGLLFNVRAVNATFDDLDDALPAGFLDDPGDRRGNNFAGYGAWKADANTERFVAALPSWRAKGILGVTLNFQGGCSCMRNGEGGAVTAGDHQMANNNPFGPDGKSIHPDYLKRMKRAIQGLDDNGMVCILGIFYFGQDQRLAADNDSEAVKRAVDLVVDWVLREDFRNVILEIGNESTVVGAYQHAILKPDRVHELFQRAKERGRRADGTRLLVSASSTGTALPPDSWMKEADFFLPHGNGLNPDQIRAVVAAHRAHPAFKANPRPICFNEDSTSIANLDAAAAAGASWGLYNGQHIQTVWPANWTIWSREDRAFFDHVAAMVHARPIIIPPDFDGDGDIDPQDFARFQNCWSGAGEAQERSECLLARLDDDRDVDGDDFALFMRCATGRNRPIRPGCMTPQGQ